MEWWLERNETTLDEDDDEDALTIQPKDNLLNPEHLYTPEVYTKAPGGFEAIRAKRIIKTYPVDKGANGKVKALNSISLWQDGPIDAILGGEFVMVMGPKGSGKSTFLRTIGLLDFADSGDLTVFARNVTSSLTNYPENLLFMRINYIGYVLEKPMLMFNLSALENVEFPMMLWGQHTPDSRRERAQELLQAFGVDASSPTAVSQLSKSEQQRVAIAQALANKPRLLLLDEPTKHLSHEETIDLMNYIQDYSRQGQYVTTVMVTDNPLLCCYSNRTLMMENGAIVGTRSNYVRRRLDKAKYVQHMLECGEQMECGES